MRNELQKLTTKQLIELVKTLEHYPVVTLKECALYKSYVANSAKVS